MSASPRRSKRARSTSSKVLFDSYGVSYSLAWALKSSTPSNENEVSASTSSLSAPALAPSSPAASPSAIASPSTTSPSATSSSSVSSSSSSSQVTSSTTLSSVDAVSSVSLSSSSLPTSSASASSSGSSRRKWQCPFCLEEFSVGKRLNAHISSEHADDIETLPVTPTTEAEFWAHSVAFELQQSLCKAHGAVTAHRSFSIAMPFHISRTVLTPLGDWRFDAVKDELFMTFASLESLSPLFASVLPHVWFHRPSDCGTAGVIEPPFEVRLRTKRSGAAACETVTCSYVTRRINTQSRTPSDSAVGAAAPPDALHSLSSTEDKLRRLHEKYGITPSSTHSFGVISSSAPSPSAPVPQSDPAASTINPP